MGRDAFQRPSRVLVIWGVCCVAFASLLGVYDVVLARYADDLRENDYRTYLGLAAIHLEEKDYLAALKQVDQALALAPENPEPYAYAGGIHYRLKHWERAIENLQAAIDHGDDSRGPRMDIVWSLIELGRFEEAATLGESYAVEVDDNTALLQYVAEAYLRAEQPAKAIPVLERALEASPENLYQLSRLATAYGDVGNDAGKAEMQARIDAIHDAIGQMGTRTQ